MLKGLAPIASRGPDIIISGSAVCVSDAVTCLKYKLNMISNLEEV